MRLVTRPLREFVDGDRDLNDIAGHDGVLFVRNGVGFAGVGELARVPLDEAGSVLSEMTCDDNVTSTGTDGIAVGWHNFAGTERVAIVPRIVVGKSVTGDAWVTFPATDEALVRTTLTTSAPAPATDSSFSIRPGVAVDTYLNAVSVARDAVRRGDITKAVIARDIIVESSQKIDIHALLRRLKATFGSSYRYSIDGFVGASPELLVERLGDEVRSLPLAGTCPRTGDPSVDAQLAAGLRASAKNQIEHRVVIDMVHDTLLPWCSYLDWQPEPDVIAVANVQHLGTRIEGRLSQPLPSVIDLVAALNPTPALGGHPRDAALRLIASHEGMQRGRYGGSVGWVDRHGNGTWAVAIRCAEFSADRRSARLFAGGGIVAESEPQAEFAETQAKFQAMLAAIVRP
ncbi:MAG: isochorismate synthase MenF [Actinomycetota bacterium]